MVGVVGAYVPNIFQYFFIIFKTSEKKKKGKS